MIKIVNHQDALKITAIYSKVLSILMLVLATHSVTRGKKLKYQQRFQIKIRIKIIMLKKLKVLLRKLRRSLLFLMICSVSMIKQLDVRLKEKININGVLMMVCKNIGNVGRNLNNLVDMLRSITERMIRNVHLHILACQVFNFFPSLFS